MSNMKLFALDDHTIKLESFPSRPNSEFPGGRAIPVSQEKMDKKEEEREIQQSEQEEDQRRPISPSSGPSSELPDPAHEENEDRKEEEEGEEPQNSIFSTEDHQNKVREKISQDVKGKEEVRVVVASTFDDDDDDDGYHTPTSPRHRIPAIQQCPGAPRRLPLTRSVKRKAEDLELYRVFCHVNLPGNILELLLLPPPTENARFVKKARRN